MYEAYWKLRFENPLDDAESLILDDKKYIKNIGKKTQTISENQGQFIGLMKFQNDGLTNLIDFYENAKNLSTFHGNESPHFRDFKNEFKKLASRLEITLRFLQRRIREDS